MSKAISHKRVERYLRECLVWMGLGHWNYHLSTFDGAELPDTPPFRTACVSIVSEASALFKISTGREWDEVKRSVIHECCHLQVQELREHFNTIKDSVGCDTWAILDNGWNTIEERTVLRMERAMMGALLHAGG